jgi:hypothetical protein
MSDIAEWTKVNAVSETEGEIWDFREEPEMVGVYLSCQENVGSNNSKLYTFEKESGDVVKVWGSHVLDDLMSKIEPGKNVKIVYCGKIQSKTGGRSYHNYEVYWK